MTKIPQNTIIEVQWLDTVTVSDWTSPEDIDKATPVYAKTIGYYHGVKRIGGRIRWITVKHNLASDGNADYTIIPWGAVLKVEKVE